MLYDVLISIFWKARIQILRAEIRTEMVGAPSPDTNGASLSAVIENLMPRCTFFFLSQILLHKDYTIIIFTASCRL